MVIFIGSRIFGNILGGRIETFAGLFKSFAEHFSGSWNVGKFLFFIVGVAKIAAVNFLCNLDGNRHGGHNFIRRVLFSRINQHGSYNLRCNDNLRNNRLANFKLKNYCAILGNRKQGTGISELKFFLKKYKNPPTLKNYRQIKNL